MAFSSIHTQLFLNDGYGQKLPIQTGVWTTQWINMEERRRLAFTLGIQGATTVAGGGFTGILLVQGTDEIQNCNGLDVTNYGTSGQPGNNGYTGSLFYNTVASGTIAITNATSSVSVHFSDIGQAFVRFAFNTPATATGSLGGSGTMFLYVTAKHT